MVVLVGVNVVVDVLVVNVVVGVFFFLCLLQPYSFPMTLLLGCWI